MTSRRPWHARVVDRLFVHAASPHDRRQRLYLALGLVILIPFVASFGHGAWRRGQPLDAGLTIGLAVLLSGVLIALTRVRRAAPAYRTCAVASLGLMVYGLYLGVWGGFAFLWLYLLPIFAMFLLGRMEGIAWTLGAGALSSLVLLAPVGHPYPGGVAIRYLVTYVVVALLALGLESSREFYQDRLRDEKSALEEALLQVEILRGLLPMCPSCKKVRDDRGYWEQIELYIGRRSGTQFSHGLCPPCAERALAELEQIDGEPGAGATVLVAKRK